MEKITSYTETQSKGRNKSPHLAFDSANINQKVLSQSFSPGAESASMSLVSQVLHDLATGRLHFALFGKSDGGLEFWRAACPPAPKPTPDQKPAIVQVEPLVCGAKTACQILGSISPTSLWELEKRGIVKQLPGFPRGKYSIAHLRQVVARQSKKQITKWE